MSDLTDLITRVEKADVREQGELLSAAASLLAPYISKRVTELWIHRAYESAAIALVERVLPGVKTFIIIRSGEPSSVGFDNYANSHAATAALALLLALLRAVEAQRASPSDARSAASS